MQFAQLLFDGSLLLLFTGGCVLVVQSFRSHGQPKADHSGTSVAPSVAERPPEILAAQNVAVATPPMMSSTAATWEIPDVGPDARDKNRLASSVSAAVIKSRKAAAGVRPAST